MVLIEWAWREQGLIVAAGNPHNIRDLADVQHGVYAWWRARKAPVVVSCSSISCGSSTLILLPSIYWPASRSETELALAVRDGKADAGFGIAAVARQCRVDFVPLHRERYDLVIRRWEYFEPPFQRLLAFTRTTRFVEKAAEFGGYDITGIGHVTYNSP